MASNRVVNSRSTGSRIFILFVGVGDDDDENDLLIQRRRRRRLMLDELLSLFISDAMEAGREYSGHIMVKPFLFLKAEGRSEAEIVKTTSLGKK